MNASPFVAVVAAAFGSLIGSFLNVCIVRWPAEESIVNPPRSKCPRCGRQLAWHENIPVISWIVLRGRCSGCAERISIQYPMIELATALIWAAAFLWPPGSLVTSLRLAVFATVMLGVAVTDARFYVIPDGFTLFGLLFVIAASVAGFLQGEASAFATPWQALLGACVGAGAISITGWLGEIAFKKEAMGFGDATLMAVCGAALGPERALLNVFVAATLGALTFALIVGPVAWLRARRANRAFEMPLVPFGVFLAPAAVVTLLYGERLIAWYVHLMPAS
jgi:leader peptidase (prepilin peptidase)/N-methyltransferase